MEEKTQTPVDFMSDIFSPIVQYMQGEKKVYYQGKIQAAKQIEMHHIRSLEAEKIEFARRCIAQMLVNGFDISMLSKFYQKLDGELCQKLENMGKVPHNPNRSYNQSIDSQP